MPADEFSLLRWDRDAPARPPPGPGGGGSPAFVGRVVTVGTTYLGHFALVHPVVVLGTEVEGGAGSLTVDTTVSIPVYLVGPGPVSAGDDLVVRWADYRWVAGRDTGGPVIPSTPCSPCAIPQVTLNLTWQYVNTSSGTTTVNTTLAYSSSTGQWRSPNLTRTDYPTGSGLDPCWTAGNTAIHWFTLYCASSGFIQLDHNCHCSFGSDVAVGAVASPGTGKVFSCSPFSLDWTLSPGADADRRYIVTT